MISKARDPQGGSAEAHDVLEDASGGLDPGGSPAGDVPVRTDDAVGASAQIRANARSVAPIGAKTRAEAREIMTRYPRSRSALLPMLHLVQAEQGYVTPDGVAMCAEELGLTKAEVGAVATFYTMFKRRPTGEYLISVCTNTLCGFLGGDDIYAALSEYLGVGHDETSADGLVTLEHAECLAACDYAPVVTVNYEFYDQQDTESALNLVKDLQRGDRPHPTRGAPLSSFAEISRQLAGFLEQADDSDGVRDRSASAPTVAGNREALRRGDESPAFDPGTPIAPPSHGARPGAADGPTTDGPTTDGPKADGPKVGLAAADPSSATEADDPAEAAEPGDPEPTGGQTAHKTSSEQAEVRADNPAEQSGAQDADPDAPKEIREPTDTPSARRTRTRNRKA